MSESVSKEVIIKVEDLTVAYEEKPVLWDIELEVKKRCAYGNSRT